MEKINYEIHPKENIYFSIRLVISIAIYALIGFMIAKSTTSRMGGAEFFIIFFYAGLILLYLFVSLGLLVGYIKGNAVKITKNQFPEAYTILEMQSEKLGIDKVPSAYILQSGGVLNAFATKFIGRNYVVIYSEIFELAYEQGQDALEFVIGHELGHIKRNHITKSLYLLPSAIIPFLASAYSRACEYTCDNIGKALNHNGAKDGLLILAAGKTLYKKVNIQEYINEERQENSFWKWFSEKISSHPNLPKRVDRMK
jgi:Zn-dependent protease with chaperone function